MKNIIPIKISAYKAAVILLILNLTLTFAAILLPIRKLQIVCLIIFFFIWGAVILLVILPLRRIHYFFQLHTLSDEESLSYSSTEETLINTFLISNNAKTRKLETTLSDQNIDSLSQQINSHFFYNTLDSIRGRAFFDGATLVADMIETLSAFFRYSISQNGNVVSLEDELSNLNSYLKIQMFRFGNRFDYKVTLDSDNVKKYQLPILTLQPIVENSIVHGIENYENDGSILVNIFETDTTIVIHIKDNGVGIPAERLNKINYNFQNNYFEGSKAQKSHLNIALNNINNRICLLYGKRYHLHIFSTESIGTNVQITLPKIVHEKEVYHENTSNSN